MDWLHLQPGWETVTPSQLIERQDKAQTKSERYAILDLAQTYANSMPAKSYKSRLLAYTAIRSFFAHNRSSLSPDPKFRIHALKPPTQGRLTSQDVRRLVAAAKVRDRSTILVKWMGLLDNKGLEYANLHSAGDLVSDMKAGKHVIILHLPGRKRQENQQPYYTLIGKDAIDALREYFDTERRGGWPKKGEPIWYDQYGGPLTRQAFAQIFMALNRRVGHVPKDRKRKDTSVRYGYNCHEMRDAAKSLLHVKAKADRFDMDVTQLMMGHTDKLDPDKYDKFYENPDYVIQQYTIAEPYLNILSGKQEPDISEDKMIERLLASPRFKEIISEVLERAPKYQGGENK
jgi:hypothetical protein